jgi:hypothetical protein
VEFPKAADISASKESSIAQSRTESSMKRGRKPLSPAQAAISRAKRKQYRSKWMKDWRKGKAMAADLENFAVNNK